LSNAAWNRDLAFVAEGGPMDTNARIVRHRSMGRPI
jgi:hypothetical protein